MSYLVQSLDKERGDLGLSLELLWLHHRLRDTGIVIDKALQDQVSRPQRFSSLTRTAPRHPSLPHIASSSIWAGPLSTGPLQCAGRRHRRWLSIVYVDESPRTARYVVSCDPKILSILPLSMTIPNLFNLNHFPQAFAACWRVPRSAAP